MQKQKIAVVGSGVAGLSAAWLLAKSHQVTLFEAEGHAGGHARTEIMNNTPIDVGFIVFNEQTYPNLTALLRHLGVETNDTEMGFSVSLDEGKIEYSAASYLHLLGSARLALSPPHMNMIRDLVRFYRTAPALAKMVDAQVSLGEFLRDNGFGLPFIERHLVPMASAIWSSHPGQMLEYPAKAFVEFFENHQLFNLGRRDRWRTVKGGSHNYVRQMTAGLRLVTGEAVTRIDRAGKPRVHCASGHEESFDQVVLACHADQALAMLVDPTAAERALLSPFRYSGNRVIVHRDPALMPRRRRHWASWNYIGESGSSSCGVTYWMNQLQRLESEADYFVSLNPSQLPAPALTELSFDCTHPIFNSRTLAAQKQLWDLQGRKNTWFCGAYFGAGFHEDGLQAGLAVAEQIGGARRPWRVANESGRITIAAAPVADFPLWRAAE